MLDALSKVLIENGLNPDSFTPSKNGDAIFRGELASGHAMQTWINLVKASAQTKYYPIIRGDVDDIHEQTDRDPESIIAAAPTGNVREILRARTQERIQSLRDMISELPQTSAAALASINDDSNLDQLAAAADASRIYSFGGGKQSANDWPLDKPDPERVGFNTLKGRKGKPSALVLIRVEHSWEVPAYLEFGGWNECPEPELQVAALREWRKEYDARPACITGDVLECLVRLPPKTEAECMKLAAEQWIFCEDIVGQGTQSIKKLAIEIWKSRTWFFWWD